MQVRARAGVGRHRDFAGQLRRLKQYRLLNLTQLEGFCVARGVLRRGEGEEGGGKEEVICASRPLHLNVVNRFFLFLLFIDHQRCAVRVKHSWGSRERASLQGFKRVLAGDPWVGYG